MLNLLSSNPLSFVLYAASLLIAITIHEASHAWMADRLGDPTARLQGRISLNPLVHLDLFGTVFLLMFGFGWGKPVEFDPFNLKNPRKDGALIALAGPTSNMILAIILSIVLYLLTFLHLYNLFVIGSIFCIPLIMMNVTLGLFNLIPIHPLDGFNIVAGFLPKKQSYEWEGLRRWGMFFLLLLIIPLGRGSMLDMVLRPLVNIVINLLIPVGKFTGVL